jgi:hypothetical protein
VKFVKRLILFCLFFFPRIVFSQSLQFYREDLTFEIKDGFFYVDGIYNFCNNGDKAIHQVLFYPFPVDSAYGEVDSISAINVNSKSANCLVNKSANGSFFKIDLIPYGIGKYKISYRQKLLKNKAEYILVTTQKWGVPFENAIYKLIAPAKMRITSFSYSPDSTKQIRDKAFYYWSKKDFMPDKNMVFYFDR